MRTSGCMGLPALVLCVASCSGGDEPSEPATSYMLTVVNGYGSGTYPIGETVHVWADVRPWTEVLTSWTGDEASLERPSEWHTTLTMPAHDATIEAHAEIRDEQLQQTSYQGSTQSDKTVMSHFPESPRGLLFILHGTNGSARMVDRPEARYLALSALARGYGVLATEAEEVAAGDSNGDDKERWSPALVSDNPDLANLDELIAGLRGQGIIAPDLPLYVLGMSNGGAMSVSLGAVADSPVAGDFPTLRFAAAISFCAGGRAAAAAISTTPTAWLLCANDDNDQVSNAAAADNSAALTARGVPSLIDEHPASPLYDQRFVRVPGVDEVTSASIASELRAGGFVGPDGMFVVPTTDLVTAAQDDRDGYPTVLSLPVESMNLVVNQIRVMQAEHQMYSDWASRAMDFLDEHGP